MNVPELDQWQPIEISEVQALLGNFSSWFLCGGLSVDHLVGRQTREHGDIDIGVYRTELERCLNAIQGAHVFLCDPPGQVREWQGESVPGHVNDIWIAAKNRQCWIAQILIYSDEGDRVSFKRDASLSWSKASHTITHDGLKMLNPAITLLYKTTGQRSEKDRQDISTLIDHFAS